MGLGSVMFSDGSETLALLPSLLEWQKSLNSVIKKLVTEEAKLPKNLLKYDKKALIGWALDVSV